MSQEKLKTEKVWAAKKTAGRKRIFECGEQLIEACLEYLQWCADNPIYKKQVVTYQGEATLVDVPLSRAPTPWGLWAFIGIDKTAWYDWRNGTQGEAFSSAVAYIDGLISDEKFTGAAVDVYNPTFIARDLGLKEGIDHSSTDGSMSPVEGNVTEIILRGPETVSEEE